MQFHKQQHLQAILKKYPTASPDAGFTIIDVEPQTWISDLEHEDRNIAELSSVFQEDIIKVSSPDWDGQPAPAGYSCQWKVRY